MRITSKGQVTIPQEIRDRLGLQPETEVAFEVIGNTVRIRKVGDRPGRGRGIVDRRPDGGGPQRPRTSHRAESRSVTLLTCEP